MSYRIAALGDVGFDTTKALEQSMAQHGGATDQSAIDAYAGTAGSVAAGAACAATGVGAAAAGVCGMIGGAVASAVADVIQGLFGSSQPTANDLFNFGADRAIAHLVLLQRGVPNDADAVHRLGESGIRALAGRQGDGSATNPEWLALAAKWAHYANAYNEAHSRRSAGTRIVWWYESGPKAGRIRMDNRSPDGTHQAPYGNGPNDKQDLIDAITAATAEAATDVAAATQNVRITRPLMLTLGVPVTIGGRNVVPDTAHPGQYIDPATGALYFLKDDPAHPGQKMAVPVHRTRNLVLLAAFAATAGIGGWLLWNHR